MSKIDPKREGLEESQENLAAPPATPRSEDRQHQLSSSELELNTTETTIEQNSQLPIQPSENEAEGLEQSPTISEQQERLEGPFTKAPQDNIDTLLEPTIATANDPTTPRQTEIVPPSQQSPLTLEMIYREIMLLQEGMQKLQTSLESQLQGLIAQISSLRKEVVELKQEKVAELKQETATTDLSKGQIDRQKKQPQLSYSPQKTPENKQMRSKKHDFNAVAYLQEHGEAKLLEELETKGNTELMAIIRSEGIKKGKDLKSIERQEIIKEIILNAERRLRQGAAFLSK